MDKKKKPFRQIPCNKGHECWHLINGSCTFWHSPEEVAAAKKKQCYPSQGAIKASQKHQGGEKVTKNPEYEDSPTQDSLADEFSKATEHLYKKATQAIVSAFQEEVSCKMEKTLVELFKTLSVEEASRISVSTSCVNAMIVNAAKDITDTLATKMVEKAKASSSTPDLSDVQ